MIVIVRKLMAASVAASMAIAPAAVHAAPAATPATDGRASADMGGANALAGEGTPVFLGLILVVLLAMVAVSGGDEPDNTPTSP